MAKFMRRINIIGAGRVGITLGLLWRDRGPFDIGDVLDRTPEGARSAVATIGAGQAVAQLSRMRAAPVWMITSPDARIASCGEALAASGRLRPGDVVFHCSGALASTVLGAAAGSGASIASVHPLKSFADPAAAARSFAGTYCAAEGDRAALEVLIPAFESVGARVSAIDPGAKTLYHAASVLVCNYLTALLEAGLRGYARAGISRDIAQPMMEPLVRETLDNVFRIGTVRALTGPIARGDDAVVARQLQVLAESDPGIARIYRALGAVAVELARAQGGADADALESIRRELGGAPDAGGDAG